MKEVVPEHIRNTYRNIEKMESSRIDIKRWQRDGLVDGFKVALYDLCDASNPEQLKALFTAFPVEVVAYLDWCEKGEK